MRFIGITGGVGAGKSKLLEYIGRHYLCEIYLADEVAHQVKAKGTSCYKQLIGLFGSELLQADGEIDRGAMAARIFGDEGLLEQVNAIVHPAVREYLLERLETARHKPEVELFFVEAALLIETGYGGLVDEMWYIYAGEDIRRERLAADRGYSQEKISSIMGNQLTEEEFRQGCDFVIDNSGGLEESFRQIDTKLEAFSWRD
ncbi:MAG: dephospho-CoA kinase [Butyrivibrio sp.]|nr:dephospho-CoA kinase [Muribaculum sp.]MCM1552272.1 dephospho-CoA kinase [Butyrivibrio sp.]